MAPDRFVPAASLPLLDVNDAVAELHHAVDIGLHLASLPTGVPNGMPDWNCDDWEPLWAAAEEAGMVLGFHIGDGTGNANPFRGPGGAVLNYVETTYGGQRVAAKLVASGALDRHPTLKVLISEGGATWVPFAGDRMNEGYRQHGMFVRPTLSRPPKEFLYRQVYASFQHDETAPAALTAMGYPNVMWGSDYPHMEGTFGHTPEDPPRTLRRFRCRCEPPHPPGHLQRALPPRQRSPFGAAALALVEALRIGKHQQRLDLPIFDSGDFRTLGLAVSEVEKQQAPAPTVVRFDGTRHPHSGLLRPSGREIGEMADQGVNAAYHRTLVGWNELDPSAQHDLRSRSRSAALREARASAHCWIRSSGVIDIVPPQSVESPD